MAQILDKGDQWELIIAPEAIPVERIEEPTKGYWATIGEDPISGTHVVSHMVYNKNQHTITDVMRNVEKLRNCTRCKTLDQEKLRVESIEVPTPPIPQTPPPAQVQYVQQPVQQKNKNFDVKGQFANVFFDAFLTNPGRFLLGTMLGDDDLASSSIPDDPKGQQQFMSDMVDFLSGDIDFVRTPEEAKRVLSVVKGDDDEDTNGTSKSKTKRKPTRAGSIVVY